MSRLAEVLAANKAAEAPKPAQRKPAKTSTTTSSTNNNRPIHPAIVTTIGPGKGGGSSELSVWAYLTRPRPVDTSSSSTSSSKGGSSGGDGEESKPLPNLVTAQSNSLRVYTVLPNAGTLALTAVYDNLAGTICSLDVIPNGTSSSNDNEGDSKSRSEEENEDDGLNEIFNDGTTTSNNKSSTTCYDGLLLGFAGHPRLSIVYPSTPMVGGGINNHTASGVGQGGVLLASSIIDLTPAIIEKSMGGLSYLEQDIIVTVSNNSGSSSNSNNMQDPCVSVVLGGGVAVASFSLPKGPRPDEGVVDNNGSINSSSSSSWWRVASEPYILPLSTLASKIRELNGGGSNTNQTTSASSQAVPPGRKYNPTIASSSAVGTGPTLSHGFGDIVDVAYLSGYTEPTLLILHSNPKRGSRACSGRLGRTAEVPIETSAGTGNEDDEKKKDDYGEEMKLDDGSEEEKGKKTKTKVVETMDTGTKYGLTLTAISLAIHQHRSVVLWSLMDSMPVDAWKLVPHPTDGVLVWGVNTIVYVSMGGKIKCALAVNGFAKIGCPPGLIPPPLADGSSSGSNNAGYLECNPSPLPKLAIQLDGARISFVTNNVAMVCLGNGSLYSLELHNNDKLSLSRTMMSLMSLGHKVGGLGVASCLSVVSASCHTKSVGKYLSEGDDEINAKKEERPETVVSKTTSSSATSSSNGPNIQTRGLVFVGSRMGDCTLLAFSMNKPIRLVVTDVDAEEDDDDNTNSGDKRKLDDKKPDTTSSLATSGEPKKKQPRLDEEDVVEILDDDAQESSRMSAAALAREEILRLEEEELYRDDDDDDDGVASPSVISASNADSEDDSYQNEGGSHSGTSRRRTARCLSMFRSIRALDSLTGLGPLGAGCYGPVATCPSLTGQDDAMGAPSSVNEVQASIFSNAFSSAARHYIMPCGFGSSGGLAVMTTPGRDNVGGSILCESDLCNMAGPIFGLPKSNLVLLGNANGIGSIALRGVIREDNSVEGKSGYVEEFDELTIDHSSTTGGDGDSMDVDAPPPSFNDASDVLSKMTLVAATEFTSNSKSFSVFVVQAPHLESNNPYSIVIMSNDGDGDKEGKVGLKVSFVHGIKDSDRGMLASITPMVSKLSEDSSAVLSITFGCVWTSGHASLFNISLTNPSEHEIDFKVSESNIVGETKTDVPFYDSNKVVAMDIMSLPSHIFDSPDSSTLDKTEDETSPTDDAQEELVTETANWDGMKVGELKTACKDRGLGISGRKADLVARLKQHDADNAAAPKQPDEDVKSNDITPDESSSLSFPPDRLSSHGTWCAKLCSQSNEPETPTLSNNRIIVAVCRRSGSLEIYDNDELLASPDGASPIWEAEGCSQGTPILGQSSGVSTIRLPEHHEVEVSEIRFFVAGPSLQPESINGIDTDKDSWMLRSLCILVDTSQGDLHLYSGSKRRSNKNRLEFARVPLSNVSRPSEEAGRHLVKLRRKGIVPQADQAADNFRHNRLHRFCDISSQDGLFAATPRPLWFVTERGAPTIVAHKSRHVSPAGGRPTPVCGFLSSMPSVFRNASSGFITMHERIGRVGSQRLTLYNGLWDVFAPHGLLPGGCSVQKVPLGVTVRHIEFIDDASISTTSRPVYAMIVSHEIEGDQSYMNDDGLSDEERQRLRDETEAAKVRKQVEADLGGFDMEQEWVEEIEREDCFTVDSKLGLAPSIPSRKYELWIVDASSSQWKVLDKYQLDEHEHGTALKVMFLTDVVEDSDEVPEKSLVIGVGTSIIDNDGEDVASKGRILLFNAKKSKKKALNKDLKDAPLELTLKSEKAMTLGPVTSLSSLKSEDVYRIVVGAGAEVTVEQWGNNKLTQMGK